MNTVNDAVPLGHSKVPLKSLPDSYNFIFDEMHG